MGDVQCSLFNGLLRPGLVDVLAQHLPGGSADDVRRGMVLRQLLPPFGIDLDPYRVAFFEPWRLFEDMDDDAPLFENIGNGLPVDGADVVHLAAGGGIRHGLVQHDIIPNYFQYCSLVMIQKVVIEVQWFSFRYSVQWEFFLPL